MYKTLETYAPLGTRNGFNTFVDHISAVINLLETCTGAKNIADEASQLVKTGILTPAQLPALLSVVLIEKRRYSAVSINLPAIPKDAAYCIKEIQGWTGIDIVLGYYHPELGFMAVNPKNPENIFFFEHLKKNELLVIYAGTENQQRLDTTQMETIRQGLLQLFDAKKPILCRDILTGTFSFVSSTSYAESATAESSAKHTVPLPAAPYQANNTLQKKSSRDHTGLSNGLLTMSRVLSIPVTNELFHNGNVEAWKRIIHGYQTRYPHNRVLIFYDGEHIAHINSLFKWGKVKNGSSISIAVKGNTIEDLSKLVKYLTEGASPRFEHFLKETPSQTGGLF